MNSSKPLKLSSTDARKLSTFLRSESAPQGTLTFNQLKGYLFGICTTPTPLQQSRWLGGVFGGELPGYSDENAALVVDCVTTLFKQTGDEIREGSYKLPSGSSLDTEISNNFQSGSALHEWSAGFAAALTQYRQSWIPLLADNAELQQMQTRIAFFSDEQSAHRNAEELLPGSSFEAAAKKIRQQLPKLLKEYVLDCQQLCADAAQENTATEQPQSAPEAETASAPAEQQPAKTALAPATTKTAATGANDTAARALLEQARRSKRPAEIVALASQVLELDPNSTEAWLLLAQWDSRNQQQFIERLEKAVAAGEAQLGAEYFAANAGQFWSLLETRPYMQALSSLARACYLNKRSPEAIELYEQCLMLNPMDNQGIRHSLINLYLELQQQDKAEALLNRFEDDGSAFFRYSRVLLSFMQGGDSSESRTLKKAAREYNKFVPKLLSGRAKMPKKLPDQYGLGNRDEAVLYITESRNAWRNVMGSVSWLLK